MNVNYTIRDAAELLSQVRRMSSEDGVGLKSGDGGGTYDGMETRVTKLETHFEYIRRDLDEMKAGQAQVIEKLNQLPTRNDLWQWKIQWVVIIVAAVAIIVGGIIGGLSWLKPDPAPATQPAPVVVYQPAPPAAEAPPAPPQQ